MSVFDDCTLAEIEILTNECLNGRTMGSDDVDPMLIAGGMMWVIARRSNPNITWPEFKAITKMGDIKSFSLQMELDDETSDPTKSLPVPQT